MVGKNATNWHMVNPRSLSKYTVWTKLLLISGWSNSQVGKEPNSKSKNSKWNIDCWRFRFVEVRELNSISCIWGRPNCSSATLNAAVRQFVSLPFSPERKQTSPSKNLFGNLDNLSFSFQSILSLSRNRRSTHRNRSFSSDLVNILGQRLWHSRRARAS